MKNAKRPWLTTEIAHIRARYPHESAHDIAADLNRTHRAVHMMAQRVGVAKSAEFLRRNGEMYGVCAR